MNLSAYDPPSYAGPLFKGAYSLGAYSPPFFYAEGASPQEGSYFPCTRFKLLARHQSTSGPTQNVT